MNVNLEWQDYAAVLVMLLLSWSVGIYYGCKNRRVKVKPEKDGQTVLTRFVLGNSKMAVLPVAFSISATTLSGSSMVGVVGEVYLYGSQYVTFAAGSVLGLVLSSLLVIPVYRRMKYISIYEYLERRYDRSVRLSFSAVYILAKMIFSSVALYVPAICVTTLTEVPQWITIAVAGTVCICYCVTGGIKAVIWTDVLQAAFMVTCNLLLICFGIQRAGGFSKVMEASIRSGRIGHVTYLETQDTRYSIWSLLFGSTVIFLSAMCAGQAAVQRILSVRGSREAQQATLTGAALVGIFLSMTAVTGLVIYANFWSCDPFLRPHESGIISSDQILVYGIAHILKQPGLKGLALAGIFSGSLSTFSSYINSFATLTVEDFIRPILKSTHRTLSDKTNVLFCKFFTFVYGFFCILLAFMVPMMGGVIQAGMQVTGATGGPLLGVIFLGIFSRRANKKGVLIGLLLGLGFCFWISIGAIFNKRPFTTLQLFDFDCTNGTNLVIETGEPGFSNATTALLKRDIFPLYRLSFMWHGPIGLTITFICGLVASILLGSGRDRTRPIDPRLMSNLFRQLSLERTSTADLTTETRQIIAETREKVEMLGALSL